MLTVWGVIAGTFSSVLLYFVAIFLVHKWRLRSFRGPMALPLVGNFYDRKAFNLIGFLSANRRKFGKIFTMFGLWRPMLVICDPVVVRRVLSDTKSFPKGKDYTERFAGMFGAGLVTSNGEKHKKDRAIFSKYFIRSNIMKMNDIINDVADQAVEELVKTCAAAGEKGKTVNVEQFSAVLALRVFMMFSIGSDMRTRPARERELCHVVSACSGAIGRVILLGLPSWFKFHPDIQTLEKGRRELCAEFDAIHDDRKARMDRGEEVVDDCLTAMIREDLPYKDKQDHFVSLIAAGHDTTAYYNAYMLLLLAQHQNVQEKLRSEILAHLNGRTVVTADDVSSITYLSKVMQEVLRFYSIIPNVTRSCINDVYVKESGLTIPKGTDLFIPMSIINRDPSIWEKPSEFNPDRFDGTSVDFTSAKNGFFPFGYGTRTCIGNTLAQIESGIFVSKLLMRCQFDVDPAFKLRIQSGISLTTYGGIDVRIRPL